MRLPFFGFVACCLVFGSFLAASQAQQGSAPLFWRSSGFMWSQNVNAYAFLKDSQLTYNPTYSWQFTLLPRWYFTDTLYLRVRQDFEVEFTHSDTTNGKHEFWLYDTLIDLARSDLIKVAGVSLGVAGRLTLPVSKSSRAAHRVLGTGLTTNIQKQFDLLAGLTLSSFFVYTHYWATSNVVSAGQDFSCHIIDAGQIGRTCGQLDGASTVRDALALSFNVQLSPIEKLSVGLSVWGLWNRAHGLADATVEVDTAPNGVVVISDGSKTHWRNSTWFIATVGYDITPWINGSLWFSTLTSNLNPDGSRRNPFFNVDTQISLVASLSLDVLYTTLSKPDAQTRKPGFRQLPGGQ